MSTDFLALLFGRAMIGLGVAASLTAGLKAIVLWFPKERVALMNGYMIMLGSLGAVTATAPAEQLLAWISWRQLFVLLAAVTGATAVLIYVLVPERAIALPTSPSHGTLKDVFRDRRFWRIAPLSATCIGSAWSLQGLWASPWLTEVEGLDRANLVRQLFMMSVVLSGAAWLFGTGLHWIRQRRKRTETVLVAAAILLIAAELALILRAPFPPIMPWSTIAAVGAATVVSFAVISDYFPTELVGRANGALNVLHFGWAFLAQYATGLILEQWSMDNGQRSIVAYQIAFGFNVVVQIVALTWFALPWMRSLIRWPGSFRLFMPVATFDAIQPEIMNKKTLMPVDDDAKW
jgi:MFS family permease